MPPVISDKVLGNTILQSVEHGGYPDSEDVASAAIQATALPHILKVIGTTSEEVKSEIRSLSRQSAPDIDGWIAQAKRLQADIERSKATAQEIVQQAESGKQQWTKVQDAASKCGLLQTELEYNETLTNVVEQIRGISATLDIAQDAAVHDQISPALDRLTEVNGALAQLGPLENTRIVGVLRTRSTQLRAAIVESTTEYWNALVHVDTAEQRIAVKDEIQRETTMNISTIVDALSKLNLLDTFLGRLSRDFDTYIISPRLRIGSDQVVSEVSIEGDDIQALGRIVDMNVTSVLRDIHRIAEYLSTRLPPSVAVPLSEKLVPIISSRLISNWLLPSVPLTMDGVQDFQETLSHVLGLAEYLDELEWTGQDRLREWVDKSAQIWLSRRQENAVADIRTLCFRGVQSKKTVERVETQTISKGDAMLGGKDEHGEHEEDWGDAWGDEDEKPAAEAPATASNEEEVDLSAWGEDYDEPQEEAIQNSISQEKKAEDAGEEDPEAWGWGDEDEGQTVPSASTASAVPAPALTPMPVEKAKINGTQPASSAPRELTLRETYTITSIPGSIIEVILQVISDVSTLNQSPLSTSAIAPASIGLYSIPRLILAMYRATATTHYSKDVAGNMLIYNDCTRISDQLRSVLLDQVEKDKTSPLPQHLRPSLRLRLDDDIKSIEGFGKRAYGREMESQRTIIRDLLDGAQGFQSCTRAPFAMECENAVKMTVDRIKQVQQQWKDILSHSVLLQSLGSLVSTALTKVINDVEDMADIAEDESKQLRRFCDELATLSELFKSDDPGGESRDMTSIYTPNWFKFQYLSEILDSSLADIKYFWTEGELKLEMEAEEVVDLVRALFAESEHRRRAIGEIRRSSITR